MNTKTERHTAYPSLRVLRPPAAAKYLGLLPATLARWRKLGEGPPFILLGGRRVGYAVGDLDEYIQAQRRQRTGEGLDDHGLRYNVVVHCRRCARNIGMVNVLDDDPLPVRRMMVEHTRAFAEKHLKKGEAS